eukprot:scaffold32850_cov118-Isochrysis_galbana.AAC.2
MSYDSINLTTPDIKWLGVRPSDLDKYNIPPQCRLEMSEHDIKTGRELLEEEFVKVQCHSRGRSGRQGAGERGRRLHDEGTLDARKGTWAPASRKPVASAAASTRRCRRSTCAVPAALLPAAASAIASIIITLGWPCLGESRERTPSLQHAAAMPPAGQSRVAQGAPVDGEVQGIYISGCRAAGQPEAGRCRVTSCRPRLLVQS